MAVKQTANATAQSTQSAVTLAIRYGNWTTTTDRTERSRLGLLAGVLLPLIHLLLELLGLLLVDEGEAGETFFQLEGVEEGAVLIVGEGVVDFLVPDDASIGRLERCLLVADRSGVSLTVTLTETSTSLIQRVLPTRSLANTAAPCKPV